jgi:hypothetical protein
MSFLHLPVMGIFRLGTTPCFPCSRENFFGIIRKLATKKEPIKRFYVFRFFVVLPFPAHIQFITLQGAIWTHL